MSGIGPRIGAGTTSGELESILLSLNRVRILHYAAQGAVSARAIFQRLNAHCCPITLRTLKWTLVGMVRLGWLKSRAIPANVTGRDRVYHLTPEGNRVLKTAQEQLNRLVIGWSKSKTGRPRNEAYSRLVRLSL